MMMCRSCRGALHHNKNLHVAHAHHRQTRRLCQKTPPWMMFAFCHAPMDGYAATLWHDIREPFDVPVNLQGHKCEWELFDDYLAGCILCGKVHRCDFDVCEEVLSSDAGFQLHKNDCETFLKCPTVQSEYDGSIICTITGSCVRDRAFGMEFEMVANNGLQADEMQQLLQGHGDGKHLCSGIGFLGAAVEDEDETPMWAPFQSRKSKCKDIETPNTRSTSFEKKAIQKKKIKNKQQALLHLCKHAPKKHFTFTIQMKVMQGTFFVLACNLEVILS